MCFDYDTYVTFQREEIRRARKPHRCDGCGRTIAPGETYIAQAGKFDSTFYTAAGCTRCAYDVARIVAHELDDGCYWSEAWPTWQDLGTWFSESMQERTAIADVPVIDWKTEWPNDVIKRLRKVEATQC